MSSEKDLKGKTIKIFVFKDPLDNQKIKYDISYNFTGMQYICTSDLDAISVTTEILQKAKKLLEIEKI